jgi:hypothetical protein
MSYEISKDLDASIKAAAEVLSTSNPGAAVTSTTIHSDRTALYVLMFIRNPNRFFYIRAHFTFFSIESDGHYLERHSTPDQIYSLIVSCLQEIRDKHAIRLLRGGA